MTDQDTYETDQPHQAWCVPCAGPVDVDDFGRCASCVDDGAHGITEPVVLEPVPDTSPRSIECSSCGTDPGSFCHEADEGQGYNCAARVEEHAQDAEDRAVREGILVPSRGRR